jgi:hypothetical protein
MSSSPKVHGFVGAGFELLVPGVIVWGWSVILILDRVPKGELITGGP